MATARRSNQDFLSGSSVGAFLNPKPAIPLRDYQKANRALQKTLEAQCVAARKAAEAAAAMPFKLPSQGKYQHVESRVFSATLGASAGAGAAGAGASAPGDSPLKENQRPFLKAGEKVARFVPPSPDSPVKPFVRASLGERKAPLPRFSDLPSAQPAAAASPPKNFLALNMTLAPAPKPAAAPIVPISQRENYGKVPEYLEARKAQWAVEESAARKEREIREACPPGHRMMPEEERIETLAMVTASLEAAKKELNAMPLRVEIPSALRRKAELEAKVGKLEDAVKIFSRPRVFVKL